MNFRDQVLLAITEEAAKLGLRHQAYHNALELERQRRKKVVASVPAKILQTPSEWAIDRKFNPFYVHKHRKSIAKSVAKKIVEQTYSPNTPETRSITKPTGGTRNISVFQIPDAAVSSLFYQILLKKNRHRFSGYSYAYRPDRNAHFAIQDISVGLAQVSRVFVAEFDFSKFFDSIDHAYLFEQFTRNGFSISTRDEHVIRSFLQFAPRGVPQGTSISLFLANLVCWELDQHLERAGLKFARYADDTVIWSADYARAAQSVEIIERFSRQTGVQINSTKSKGIRLLCPKDMPAEFAERTDAIEFLGYSISVDRIGIKAKSVNKIKRQINFILFQYLIQPLQGAKLQAVEIPSNNKDRDLVAALSSIRRYLYGNLSEEYIRRYLAGGSGRLFYKGVMSFYPLLSDKGQMQELDGWLVNQVWKCVQARERLLRGWNFVRNHSFPFNVPRATFAETLRTHRIARRAPRLYAIPSFVVVYLALRKAVSEEGVQQLLASDY